MTNGKESRKIPQQIVQIRMSIAPIPLPLPDLAPGAIRELRDPDAPVRPPVIVSRACGARIRRRRWAGAGSR